ncbi:MAG: YbaN family protein [Rhodospirillales bacterium]|nr:YbaN family protein [Rhodospirillales bacterium]
MDPDKSSEIKPDNLANCTARYALLAFAWLNVALGMIGVIVPGMPTTVFLIVAIWAFSKCSVRFQRWLWEHPRFGPSIQAWHHHRVIPVRAKVLAATMMASSFGIVTFFVADSWELPAFMAAVMIPVCAWIITRASEAPETAQDPT